MIIITGFFKSGLYLQARERMFIGIWAFDRSSKVSAL